MDLKSSQCVVIKIGSSLLIDEGQRGINETWLTGLRDDVVMLLEQGIRVVIVSSGAVALGRFSLGIKNKHIALDTKQAASAVGQIDLMQHYHSLFDKVNINTAQVLVSLDDTENHKRFINLRNTFKKLLDLNVIPIVNENDSVGTIEIRYGDNDRLSARVAQMVDADTLILLSDIDGFYTDNPQKNPSATIIPRIKNLTPSILSMAKGSATDYGSGGMRTKLEAAKIAMNSGCRMLIASGKYQRPILNFIDSKKGTWFDTKGSIQTMKKRWLQEHLNPAGSLIVDDGAVSALQKGASLLPVGIIKIVGEFQKGATVKIITASKEGVACGLSNYASHELVKLLGIKTENIFSILGYEGCDEAIHRDNLAMFNQSE
jgi:glutamate 5-kinase